MTYRLTENAERDVIHVFVEGVATFGINQAEAYQDLLEHTFKTIADNPGMARERIEITPPVRVHPCGSHMIIYVIDDEGPLILAVRHHREDWVNEPVSDASG